MPFAAPGTVSTDPIEDGIAITEEQYLAAIDGMMEGKMVTIVDGALVVDFPPEPEPEPQPEPVDPLTLTLTKRQVNAAMIIGGQVTDPDAAIEGAISQVQDPIQRALSLNDWRHAPYYERQHDLFNDPDLLAAMNMTPQQVDQLWQLGTMLPA